jgi:hypothetical protein
MRLLKELLVGLLALLVLTMLAVFLTPLEAYVPKVEQMLARQLHEPVSIQRMSLAVFPLPHVELQEVRLGEGETISARSVDVELDLFSLLLEGRAVVRAIVVRDGVAHLAPLRKLVELFSDPAAVRQGIAVRELALSGMSLQFPGLLLGNLEGKLEFDRTGRWQSATLAMDEQRMAALLVPMPGRRLFVQVQAREWMPPHLPQLPQLAQWKMDSLQLEGVLSEGNFIALKFAAASRGISLSGSAQIGFADGWQVKANLAQANASLEQVVAIVGSPVELSGTLSAKGVVDARAKKPGELQDNLRFDGEMHASHIKARIAAGFPQTLDIDEIKAHVDAEPEHLMLSRVKAELYGGRLSGEASVDRNQDMLKAKLVANGIAMRPLVEALSNEVLVTGSMDSSTDIAMHLGNFEQFPGNFQASGNFHLRDGTLTKLDLVQAASNPGAIYKGVTRFDDLTSLFKVDAAGYHFREVKISSGSLDAEGWVDITPSLQLKGALETDVKGTAGLMSMPMVVSGTLDKPVVSPSGSVLAGAAVGTAILGPGMGTAVGIRVGGFLNKLLGSGDRKNGKTANDPSPEK